MFSWCCAILCAIELVGVSGSGLRARAFFNANNVKRGDPLVLTVDFIGDADFKNLHPPALSRHVDRKEWHVYDESAKTDTFRDARRLTYRVRPKREGVIWFPALEFSYVGKDGKPCSVRANAIPVHAKGGVQVVVEEMGDEDDSGMPKPPELIVKTGPLSEDEAFQWRKALSKPSADAFVQFDFPEARMNEATCAIRDKNWVRALKIYQKLEWSTGQTPEIEKGIVAALAIRYENPAVELPVWRQVLRPILRYGWMGRVGIVVGGFALLTLVFWLLGRGIRAVACLTVAVGFCLSADAQGIFQQMEAEMQRMQQRMQQAFGGGGLSMSFGGQQRESVRISATVTTSKRELQVGDPFEFILSIEYPRTASVGQIRVAASENYGLRFTGQASNLADGKSANPSNVVKRLSLPARYDVPYRGSIVFSIEGMVSGRQSRRGGAYSFTFSNSFRADTNPLKIDVKPLVADGQPKDFAGIVSEGLRIHESCDILTVETNDIVTISYRVFPNGYVPDDFLPKDAAFEWTRQKDRDGNVREIVYHRYFVASGEPKTPVIEIPYYDPRSKTYKRAKTGGTPLKYVIMSANEGEAEHGKND